MLLFGHTGVTVGIFRVCDILANRLVNDHESNSGSRFYATAHKKRLPVYHLLNGLRSRIGSIDYRLVLLGSLLPDIIDKPLWLFASSDIFRSGRAYSHTFLFNLVLLICGLILIKYRKPRLLIISLSSFTHLVQDQMWHKPVALWWPLLGQFPRQETVGWMSNIIHALFSDGGTYMPEIIGLIITLLLGYRLLSRKGTINFIRTGAID